MWYVMVSERLGELLSKRWFEDMQSPDTAKTTALHCPSAPGLKVQDHTTHLVHQNSYKNHDVGIDPASTSTITNPSSPKELLRLRDHPFIIS